jgi:hypothetical protein
MGKRLVYNWEKAPNKKFTIGEKTHNKKNQIAIALFFELGNLNVFISL